MNILNILNEIAADQSRLAKEAILEREKDNELLKAVIVATYNPYINYFQKKIPAYKATGKFSLEDALKELDVLSSRKLTGGAAIDYLVAVLSNINEDDAEVITRVIDRDLKAGFSESTANKIWPMLVPTFDVMLSHKDISGISYPAYAQTKMDGARCHLHFDGDKVTAFSRSGKTFKLHGAFDDSADIMMQAGDTLDGEIIFVGSDGKFLDRKTSNGLANKANKGTLSEDAAKNAVFVAWDIVDFTSKIPYKNRFEELTKRFTDSIQVQLKTRFRLVKSQIVNSEEEAVQFYDQERALKEEGAILKNILSMWVPKRTKDLGKMKAEEEGDLRVVGYKLGKVGSKYEGLLGSLECESSDGLVKVNVSGMDEDIRFSKKNLDDWINCIIAVRYNEIIKDKKTGTYSLFLPRFIEERFDKKVANWFGELK
jgi:DNA ligase-1